MKVKNFIYAGLDFIFDKNGNFWFLEANGATRGFVEYQNLYKSYEPVIGIAKFMKSKGRNNCILISKKERFSEEHASNKWLYKKLKEYMKLHACYIEDNQKRTKYLIDKNGNLVKPDCILCHDYKVSKKLSKRTITINNCKLRKFVWNKYKTLNLVKKHTKIKTPRTFVARNNKQLKEILIKHSFKNGFVIKPIGGTEGKGVHVVGNHEKIPRINKKMLLQERITPKLIHKKYWDVRIFIINGKFCGGIMRESIHRVTNIARGASAYRVPKKILNKLKRPALKIVSVIDKNFKKEG